MKSINDLIATHVFEWKVLSDGRWEMERPGEGSVIGNLPRFSEDIDAANTVVAHMLDSEKARLPSGTLVTGPSPKGYFCDFGNSLVEHESWPMAICMSSLRKLGVTLP